MGPILYPRPRTLSVVSPAAKTLASHGGVITSGGVDVRVRLLRSRVSFLARVVAHCLLMQTGACVWGIERVRVDVWGMARLCSGELMKP
jgi:hypothetical protein